MTQNPTHEWIRPLRLAANDFLEALVDEIWIQRHQNDNGFSMSLEYHPESKALWHSRGKDAVRSGLGGRVSRATEEALSNTNMFHKFTGSESCASA